MIRHNFIFPDNKELNKDLLKINDNDQYNNRKIFALDINLTQDCNFACKYCMERGYFKPNKLESKVYKELCNKIDYLLSDKSDYCNHICIGLWGGEPTLNREAIEYIFKHNIEYKDNIDYKLFTNSVLIDEYLELFNLLKDNNQSIEIQVSYDGLPIHNLNRIDRNHKQTGKLVRDNIIKLTKLGLSFHLKSTITFKDMSHIYDSYKDICELSDECNEINHSCILTYAPTIDYSLMTYNTLNDDNVKEYLKVFEEQLLLIAKDEYERVVNLSKPSILHWFRDFTNIDDRSRAFCGAGNRFKCMDIDGNIYACHGCLFSKNLKEHYHCSIFDSNKDFENLLKSTDSIYNVYINKYVNNEPIECQQCDSLVCTSCNSVNYELSNKKSYIDRWWDNNTQPYLCKFYKLVSNILRALNLKYIKSKQV